MRQGFGRFPNTAPAGFIALPGLSAAIRSGQRDPDGNIIARNISFVAGKARRAMRSAPAAGALDMPGEFNENGEKERRRAGCI
ncbi:MAG: hypothetical protein ACREFV_11590, partial [Acetobacteraceae bacterium]